MTELVVAYAPWRLTDHRFEDQLLQPWVGPYVPHPISGAGLAIRRRRHESASEIGRSPAPDAARLGLRMSRLENFRSGRCDARNLRLPSTSLPERGGIPDCTMRSASWLTLTGF